MDRSRRRIALALAATFAGGRMDHAFAQQRRPWKIGLLMPVSTDPHYWNALTGRLRELGYLEGRDVVYLPRSAEGNFGRLPALAQELVGARVDLIVTAATPGAQAAKQATATIPIVIATAGDPVSSGVVANLGRPGGNVSGVSNRAGDVSAKMYDLVRLALPKITRVGLLRNPANLASEGSFRRMGEAAGKAGLAILGLQARSGPDVDAAFAVLAREKAGALIVLSDPFLESQRERIARLALVQRVPLFVPVRDMVRAGALISYGADYADHFRRAASFVDRILKGAKPGELPIEQADTFELIVNRTTAAALGLAIPQEVLLRATEVID